MLYLFNYLGSWPIPRVCGLSLIRPRGFGFLVMMHVMYNSYA